MMIGVNHVQITIPEGREQEARQFYCSLMGLQEIEKPSVLLPNGGFWLQSGNIQVHVGVEEGVDRLTTRAHVAYEVKGIDDWRAKLEVARVEFLQNLPIPGYKRLAFRDPFGNMVELIEKVAELYIKCQVKRNAMRV